MFNQAQDLGEQTNLGDKQPDIRDRLAAELGRYLAEDIVRQWLPDRRSGR